MKFKITSTECRCWRYDLEYFFKKYPQLKNKIEVTDLFYKGKEKRPEAIITLNSLEELTELSALIDTELIFYKGYYSRNGEEVYDDIYTIEIYDDWRE